MVNLPRFAPARTLLLAFGGNVAGRWGSPRESIERACRELERAGVKLVKVSSLFSTEPVGQGRQPRYLNAVALAEPGIAPGALLRLAKRIERRAGRRLGARLAARPLDIDILDYGGRRLGRAGRGRARGRLILPHPELHARAFVLQPLLQVAPAWRHPVLGLPARTLLARLSPPARSGVRQALDFASNPCDKVGC